MLPLVHYACLRRSTQVPEGMGRHMGHFLFFVTVTAVCAGLHQYNPPLQLLVAGSCASPIVPQSHGVVALMLRAPLVRRGQSRWLGMV